MKIKKEEREALLFELRDLLRFAKDTVDVLESHLYRDDPPAWNDSISEKAAAYVTVNPNNLCDRLYGSDDLYPQNK